MRVGLASQCDRRQVSRGEYKDGWRVHAPFLDVRRVVMQRRGEGWWGVVRVQRKWKTKRKKKHPKKVPQGVLFAGWYSSIPKMLRINDSIFSIPKMLRINDGIRPAEEGQVHPRRVVWWMSLYVTRSHERDLQSIVSLLRYLVQLETTQNAV